jgi:hypothetical protein
METTYFNVILRDATARLKNSKLGGAPIPGALGGNGQVNHSCPRAVKLK